jgi:hypothetical protein
MILITTLGNIFTSSGFEMKSEWSNDLLWIEVALVGMENFSGWSVFMVPF